MDWTNKYLEKGDELTYYRTGFKKSVTKTRKKLQMQGGH